MVCVFAVFATLSLLFYKQFGVGLAVAILIDATIVRGVLLPATMKLLGARNWYLPSWLEWLPHFDHGELETRIVHLGDESFEACSRPCVPNRHVVQRAYNSTDTRDLPDEGEGDGVAGTEPTKGHPHGRRT